MKRYIKSIVTAGILSSIGYSCSESFTETTPIGKINGKDYLKTNEQAEAALFGVYDLFQECYNNNNWSSAFFIKVLPGDDGTCAFSNADQAEYHNFDDYAVSPANSKLSNLWNAYYRTIGSANNIITNVAKENITKKDMIVAEAKVLRAFNYLEMVTLFGEVPLRIENPSSSDQDFNLAKSTKAQIYAQIEKDLSEAIPFLNEKGKTPQKFRISKGSALSILGKAYLYQAKWKQAHETFAKVISSNLFGLEPDFKDVWRSKSENGIESVLELSYVSTQKYNWGNFPWGGRPESNLHVQLMGPRDGIFLNLEKIGIMPGWGFNMPTKKIGDLFYSEKETVRKEATLISEADALAKGVKVEGSMDDYQKYIRLKYVTRKEETDTVAVAPLNFGINWRLIRYADVLLMAAEAYQKDGKSAEALVELNKVRARAKMPLVTAAGEDLFEAIVKERQLELAFEGHRFWDLVRWGKGTSELSGTAYNKSKDTFPIPVSEMGLNSALK